MYVVDKLLNAKEQIVFHELQRITKDNGLQVYPTHRLADVIKLGNTRVSDRVFQYYTKSHFDFVVTDHEMKPLMVVEYDGPHHSSPQQQERDSIKNDLCAQANLGILRVNDQHVTKLYRGMSVLRWIVEVKELEKSFYDAQRAGHVPYDEPFDPLNLSISGRRKFPYWISVDANKKINRFLDEAHIGKKAGWHTFVGFGGNQSIHNLACLHFDNMVLYTHTSVAKQGLDFPHYDLASEIEVCELGQRLELFLKGGLTAVTAEQFRVRFDDFRERYNASPSYSRGSFALNGSWNPNAGWQYR